MNLATIAGDEIPAAADNGPGFDVCDTMNQIALNLIAVRQLAIAAGCLLAAVCGFRHLPAQDLYINEILAVNNTVLADDDGEFSDGIEIHNPGTEVVDAAGWFLSDDPTNPVLWRIPGPGTSATEIPAGGFLVVFASGKDRVSDGDELHASFSLRGGGEFLGLYRPDGTVSDQYSPSYPPQRSDISYGRDPLGAGRRYFPTPTLGAPNAGGAWIDFVFDTSFSVDRGYYDEPFDVEITSATAGASVYYTIDGSEPRPPGQGARGESLLYGGPVHIAGTTTLRAAAFLDGYGPTNVDTQTYVFLDDVLVQDGAGLPETWDGFLADYEMDPDVVNDPLYADTIRDDLKSLPTLSVVLHHDDLFGPTEGIYTFPKKRGVEWERPCSMEWFDPRVSRGDDPTNGVQVNCGVRMWGAGSRNPGKHRKHSFRLLFKRDYGPPRLDFPIFPGWDVDRFNTLIVRGEGDWIWDSGAGGNDRAQYMRDDWVRYTAREMGKETTSSTHVHLYVNGLYWGLYNLLERPDGNFMEDHFGGESADYDALNLTVGQVEVTEGSDETWESLVDSARMGFETADDFLRVSEIADIPDLIQYMIFHFYAGSNDWAGANGNNVRIAGAPALGFPYKYFLWDMETSIHFPSLNNTVVSTSWSTPATLHAALMNVEDYRLFFGDHVYRYFFNGGCLSPETAAANWMLRAANIDRAVVGESARWGDGFRTGEPYTRADWIAEQRFLLNVFFPDRPGIVLDQLTNVGLFPTVQPPSFNQRGGKVARGFDVFLTSPEGRTFYTVDGSDPRLIGGDISPDALEVDTNTTGLLNTAFVTATSDAKVLVPPADDSLGLEWIEVDFDDSTWTVGQASIGFEGSSGYEALILTDLLDVMHRESSSVYLRVEFDLEDAAVDVLTLAMKYDDGYIAYLNGSPLTSANAPAEATASSRATGSRSDIAAIEFDVTNVTDKKGLLRAGKNVLSVHGLNRRATDADFLIVPELRLGRFVGDLVVIESTTPVQARALVDGVWSVLEEATFVPGDSEIRVTEVHYHPANPPPDSVWSDDDFEFLEMQNVGNAPVGLYGLEVDGEVRFRFSEVSTIAPAELVVLVKNREAFESRYGTEIPIAGVYDGNLSNGGGTLVLRDALSNEIQSFTYRDDWYLDTDGVGFSLVMVDPFSSDLDGWSQELQWLPGESSGGSPGAVDSFVARAGSRLPGDANRDAALDIGDAVAMLILLFAPQNFTPPCDDDLVTEGGSSRLLDLNGDSAVDDSDVIYLLRYLFLSSPPPTLGTDCVWIPGCDDECR